MLQEVSERHHEDEDDEQGHPAGLAYSFNIDNPAERSPVYAYSRLKNPNMNNQQAIYSFKNQMIQQQH